MLRGEGVQLWCRLRVELMRHPTMECCCAVQTLRALHASIYEPCSDLERHPYRTHQRFRRQRRDHDHQLGHRPGEQSHPRLERRRHPGHRPDVEHLKNHLGGRHQRQPDERHQRQPDEPDRRHQPDEGHLGAVRLGDPCPVKVRTDCCLDGSLGVECPCPELRQTGCCLGVECPGWPLTELKLEVLEH